MLRLGSRTRDICLRGPWVTLLPLLVVLPFLFSGAFRFTFAVSMGTALFLVLIVVALGLAAVRRFGIPSAGELAESPHAGVAALVVTLVLTAVMFRLWWTPGFGGLPNTIFGVDLGSHLTLYHRFTALEHKQYEGFVGMYALMYWYAKIFGPAARESAAIYDGLRFMHYTCLLAMTVALGLVVYPVLARIREPRRLWATAVVCLIGQLAVLGYVLFVPLEYYAAEGFYSQIAGLYPLVFGWLFYGLIEHAGTRFVVACAWLVVQRFTYGLNLADTLLTLGYVTLWDASAIPARWLRYGAFAFVPVAFYTAYEVVLKLLPMRTWGGYFTEQVVPWILGVQCVLSIALLMAPSALTSAGARVSDASVRLWRYAGVFGIVNGGLTAIYLAQGEPVRYYILKYSLYAMVLVPIAALGPVFVLVSHLFSRELTFRNAAPTLRLGLGMSLLAALSFVAISKGYALHQPLARERAMPVVPNQHMLSHYEPRTDAFIHKTLDAHHATFGGYFDPYFPRSHVHNALFGIYTVFPSNEPHRYFNESVISFPWRVPGRCYFILGEPEWFHNPPESPVGVAVREVKSKAEKCTKFVPKWGDGPFTVCATCYPAQASASR